MIKAIEKERNAIASGKAASPHPYANKMAIENFTN
jgi:hypothetical protein